MRAVIFVIALFLPSMAFAAYCPPGTGLDPLHRCVCVTGEFTRFERIRHGGKDLCYSLPNLGALVDADSRLASFGNSPSNTLPGTPGGGGGDGNGGCPGCGPGGHDGGGGGGIGGCVAHGGSGNCGVGLGLGGGNGTGNEGGGKGPKGGPKKPPGGHPSH